MLSASLAVFLLAHADPCQDQIPGSLQSLVAKQYPAYRLPRASDTEAFALLSLSAPGLVRVEYAVSKSAA
jgi:hypothetical protein